MQFLNNCVRFLYPNFFLQICLPYGFIFQEAHTAKLAQDWIASKLDWPQPSGLSCLGSYAWMLQVISTQAGEHRWAQESSAVGMGPAANQQSHIELPEKTLGLCESWWWTLQTYTKTNYLSDFGICNNSQCFLTLKITSSCWLFCAELKIWHRIFIQP